MKNPGCVAGEAHSQGKIVPGHGLFKYSDVNYSNRIDSKLLDEMLFDHPRVLTGTNFSTIQRSNRRIDVQGTSTASPMLFNLTSYRS